MKNQITRTIIIFIATAVVFTALLITAGSLTTSISQTVLISTGSAILASGLTFFMIRMFQIVEKR
jgi:hypothetical protein